MHKRACETAIRLTKGTLMGSLVYTTGQEPLGEGALHTVFHAELPGMEEKVILAYGGAPSNGWDFTARLQR